MTSNRLTAKDGTPSPNSAAPPSPSKEVHPAVDVYLRWVRREYKPPVMLFCTGTQTALIAAAVTDMARWERTLTYWAKGGWRSNNVEGILDAYEKDAGGARARASPAGGGERLRGEYAAAANQPRYSPEQIAEIRQKAETAKTERVTS